MSAPIIKHAETSEVSDAPGHPIPALQVLDIWAARKDGGADLVIVIASPLAADEFSQRRLLDKIRGYLGFLSSEEFKAEAGANEPTPEKTRVVVKIHAGSDPLMFTLLEKCKPWVQDNGATLVVELIEESVH